MENYLKITSITGRMVLDSRGYPTVEAVLATEHYSVSASVPSGASTGSHEAHELRDGGKRWEGRGVRKAIRSIETIGNALRGEIVVDQERIDRKMIALDGTRNKRKLGANAMLAVSIAVAKAAALHTHKPLYRWIATLAGTKPLLPRIYANVLNGGRHAANPLAFQEFMIVSHEKNLTESIRSISETYHALHDIVARRGTTGLGDEGGFAPDISSPQEALELLEEASRDSGHRISIAIDVAASEFYDGTYQLGGSFKPRTAEDMIEFYEDLITHYPIISIEDPFHEDDFASFSALSERVPIQIVGDDLTVTNPDRIRKAIDMRSVNTLLLKINQIGTLSEAIEAYNLARNAGWNVMVSHRSGETEDHFIADLATGLGCGQIKIGAPARGERTAKYNQLLRLEALDLAYNRL